MTMECIAKGKRDDCFSCPVALAMIAAGLPRPSVDNETASWRPPFSIRECRPLPDTAIAFISSFDKGEPVSPFSFDLDV